MTGRVSRAKHAAKCVARVDPTDVRAVLAACLTALREPCATALERAAARALVERSIAHLDASPYRDAVPKGGA